LLELGGVDSARVVHTECQGRGDHGCVWTMLTDGLEPPSREQEPVAEPQCSSLGST
jgi:hypothetical protein